VLAVQFASAKATAKERKEAGPSAPLKYASLRMTVAFIEFCSA
jgi:hypothetical protein